MVLIIIIKVILLIGFLLWVENYSKIKKYNTETKFNTYRSLMCLFFALYSLQNTILNIVPGYLEPFSYHNIEFIDISEWFISYLIVDIGKMIYMKSVRWDLYIHHIWCLIGFVAGFIWNKIGFYTNLLLINESISIVSGIDSMFMEDNDLENSIKCKIYRKNIIKYLRLPLWITTLLISIHNYNSLPIIGFSITLITSFLMIYLDNYWEKKCDKVIKNKNKI